MCFIRRDYVNLSLNYPADKNRVSVTAIHLTQEHRFNIQAKFIGRLRRHQVIAND
jgi:hypothetical protein